jgi:hypothetical protein
MFLFGVFLELSSFLTTVFLSTNTLLIVLSGVFNLCDEIQEDQIDTNDEHYRVTFHRCNESDIPEAWVISDVIQYS